MKRLLSLFLFVVIIITAYGCGESSVTNNPSNQQQPIQLTKNNIDDYLMFSVSSELTKVTEFSDKEYHRRNVTVSAVQMRNVEFVDLNVEIMLRSPQAEYGWATIYQYSEAHGQDIEFKDTLRIPFNGTMTKQYSLGSGFQKFVSSNPTFEVVVVSVSGQAVIR